MKLVGRQHDLEVMFSGLDVSMREAKSVLVLHGDAGVGKTALINTFVDEIPSHVRLLRTDGVESESGMGYAALHRLLQPLMTAATALPDPQSAALNVAFGLVDGPTPERFHVGLAALTLVSDAAAEAPILCAIDDAHWIDPDSLDALAFVARRLQADAVSMLFAVREDIPTPALNGLPRHNLLGLDDADAATVLAQLFDRRIAPAVAARIAHEAGGNPLALKELARTYSADQLVQHAARPTPLPIRTVLLERYQKRFSRLPADAQLLLVVLAADQRVDANLLADSAADLGIDLSVLDSAELAGLISTRQDTIRFIHPLIRSACYQAANPTDLRRAHALLATSLDPEADTERHAWHRGLAAIATDEQTAAVLAKAAHHAGRRGARTSEVELLARAAELTPDRDKRARRYLQAAGAAALDADSDRVRHLVEMARSCTADELRLAQALHIEALAPVFDRQYAHAPRLLLQAAQALDQFDRNRARAVALQCWTVLSAAKTEAVGLTAREFALAAKQLPRQSTGEPTVMDLFLDGYVDLILHGWTVAGPALVEAVRRWPADVHTVDDIHSYVNIPAWTAMMLWDYDGLSRVVDNQVSITRSAGALNPLRSALISQRQLETLTGQFDRADITAIEIDDLTMIMDGINEWHCVAVGETAACRGDRAATETVMAGLVHLASSQALGTAAQMASLSAAVLANGSRDYDEAAAAATRVADDHISEYSGPALAELAEALVHLDDRERLSDVLKQIDERASVSGTKIAQGIAARCRALASKDSDADDLYRQAIDHLTVTSCALDLARSHLVYGEWLRRENRRVDAREQLRAAYEQLCDIGADGFAERARTELEATGEHARRRDVSTVNDLTPQERQVATLAGQGLTNKEIAGQLYISARTVDYHLRKVYRKLNLDSRRELAKTTIA